MAVSERACEAPPPPRRVAGAPQGNAAPVADEDQQTTAMRVPAIEETKGHVFDCNDNVRFWKWATGTVQSGDRTMEQMFEDLEEDGVLQYLTTAEVRLAVLTEEPVRRARPGVDLQAVADAITARVARNAKEAVEAFREELEEVPAFWRLNAAILERLGVAREAAQSAQFEDLGYDTVTLSVGDRRFELSTDWARWDPLLNAKRIQRRWRRALLWARGATALDSLREKAATPGGSTFKRAMADFDDAAKYQRTL